jgi:hypothetical protein
LIGGGVAAFCAGAPRDCEACGTEEPTEAGGGTALWI